MKHLYYHGYCLVFFLAEEANTLAGCKTRVKAVTKFLKKLYKVQDKPGIFEEICDALKSSGKYVANNVS